MTAIPAASVPALLPAAPLLKGEGVGEGTDAPLSLPEPPTEPEPAPEPDPAPDPVPEFEPGSPALPDGYGAPVPLGAIWRLLPPVGKGAALVL